MVKWRQAVIPQFWVCPYGTRRTAPSWRTFCRTIKGWSSWQGGHIANSALHLTAEEKQFLSQRTALLTYTGTGSGGASVTLPFLPRRLTVYAQGKPSLLPRSDGGWDVFSQVWLQGEGSASYGTGGISVAADTLTAQLSEGAFSGETGLYHALNRSGVTYVVELEA